MIGIPVLANGDPVRVTRVITGNYEQFRNWCMFSRVNPNSGLVKYVHSEFDMRGLPDFDVVWAGLCGNRRDIVAMCDVVEYLRQTGRVGREYFQYECADIEPKVVSGYPGQTDD